MMNKLVIGVIGHRNSGKSETWNVLFERKVRTGGELRKLFLFGNMYIDVFLVSGSPEERGEYVGDLITINRPHIVLCSMQYHENVDTTFQFFLENEYSMYVHWLNPGYKDSESIPYGDYLGLISFLMHQENCTVSIRDGKQDCQARVQEIKQYLYGWAKYNNLLIKE